MTDYLNQFIIKANFIYINVGNITKIEARIKSML